MFIPCLETSKEWIRAMNEQKLEEQVGLVLNELGAATNAALVITGDRLGLYRALSEGGEMSSDDLAQKTGTHERYVREWLSAQAGSGFVTYNAETGRFSMTPEQSAVLANPEGPFFLGGGFHSLRAIFDGEPKLTEAFRTGDGIGWGDHCNCLFCGTEKFFKPAYQANLIEAWLPALDGVTDKLKSGARVADIGCGHGISTLLMAKAFPKSEFIGFDFHQPSIDQARAYAGEAGVTNLRFETARAQDFAADGFDLVTIFDALHDMGDPAGALRNIAKVLRADGTLMVVEPTAGDSLQENLHTIGRLSYAFSTALCVPASLAQEGRAALGAQAGGAKLAALVRENGFSQCRIASTNPFNTVLEARL